MGTSYDTREALDLLASAAEKTKPDRKGELAAAEALLKSLLELDNQTTGAKISKLPSSTVVMIELGAHRMFVNLSKNRGLTVSSQSSQIPVPIEGLRYNPLTKAYEGEEPDPDVTPEPGKLRLRRSPLAVVVEAALIHEGLLPARTPKA